MKNQAKYNSYIMLYIYISYYWNDIEMLYLLCLGGQRQQTWAKLCWWLGPVSAWMEWCNNVHWDFTRVVFHWLHSTYNWNTVAGLEVMIQGDGDDIFDHDDFGGIHDA